MVVETSRRHSQIETPFPHGSRVVDSSSDDGDSFEIISSGETSEHTSDETSSWSHVNHTSENVTIDQDNFSYSPLWNESIRLEDDYSSDDDETTDLLEVGLSKMVIENLTTLPDTCQTEEKLIETVKVQCDPKGSTSSSYPPMSPFAPTSFEVLAQESRNLTTSAAWDVPSPFERNSTDRIDTAIACSNSKIDSPSSNTPLRNKARTALHSTKDLRCGWERLEASVDSPLSQPPAVPRRGTCSKEIERKDEERGTPSSSSRPVEASSVTRIGGESTVLASSFQPPHHLMISPDASFEEALTLGKLGHRPVLVSLQSYHESFACHLVNRDLFRNELVEDLIRSKFVFWQTAVDTSEGRMYALRYKVKRFPYLAIIHPEYNSQIWGIEGWTETSAWDVTSIVEAMTDICFERYTKHQHITTIDFGNAGSATSYCATQDTLANIGFNDLG